MPTALAIDKELIKSLYINGVAPARIAEQTGLRVATISQWIRRGNWKAELPAEKPAEDVALKNVADEVNNKTLAISRRILCKLENSKLEGIRDCKEAASALAATYATARKTLGLDDDKSGPRSVIAIFQGAVPPALVVQGDQRAVQANVGPVIDVPDMPTSDTQSDGECATPNSDGHSESVPDSQSNPQSNEPLEGEQSPPEA